MKTFNIALLSLALLGGFAAAGNADARGGFHSHARFGVFIGAPLFPYYSPYYSPYYYPPAPYYYPPAVAASPPVYVEQSVAAPAVSAPPSQAGQSASWYYCRDSQTYYPYVQQCASPWQQVAPQSPPSQQ